MWFLVFLFCQESRVEYFSRRDYVKFLKNQILEVEVFLELNLSLDSKVLSILFITSWSLSTYCDQYNDD